jgi:hypothetical protein
LSLVSQRSLRIFSFLASRPAPKILAAAYASIYDVVYKSITHRAVSQLQAIVSANLRIDYRGGLAPENQDWKPSGDLLSRAVFVRQWSESLFGGEYSGGQKAPEREDQQTSQGCL